MQDIGHKAAILDLAEEKALAISARLKEARLKADFKSAKAFAKKFNFSEGTYQQHESANRRMPLNVVMEYCEALDINIDWLITGINSHADNMLPVIPWGDIISYVNGKKTSDSYEKISVSGSGITSSSFVTTVISTQFEPLFSEHSRLVVSFQPPPQHNSFILLERHDAPVIKKLIIPEPGSLFVKFVNPDLPGTEPLDGPDAIIGRILQVLF